VIFSPTLGGKITGTLTIADDVINGSLVIPLTGTGQDFALSATSASASTARGGTADYSLSLSSQGGFTGTVQISCTGAPSESSFSACPASADISTSGDTTIVVSLKTSAPVLCAILPPSPFVHPDNKPLTWITLFCLLSLLLLMAYSKQRLRAALLASTVVLIGCLSCGGNGSPKGQCSTSSGTPTGGAKITISASSGNLQHAVTLNLNVTH
jgi:hypothetical protein